MGVIMDYAFDKLTGRLIIHINGSDRLRIRAVKYQKAFESDRWWPGSDVLFFISDVYSPPALQEIDDLYKLFERHSVRKVAIMSRDVLAEATADTAKRIAKMYQISLKYFTDLQEMFDWINDDIRMGHQV
jgi:Lon protease-like protein